MVRHKLAKREILVAAGCVVLAIGTLTFYIWQQSTLIMLGYRTSKLETSMGALNEDIRRLETEKASLLSLDKVEQIARDQLQLTNPRQDQIIYEGLPRAEEK